MQIEKELYLISDTLEIISGNYYPILAIFKTENTHLSAFDGYFTALSMFRHGAGTYIYNYFKVSYSFF